MQYALVLLSRLARSTFWRCNTGVATFRGQSVRFGVPGQPDIQGVAAGRWVGIEMKTEKGRQSAAQKAFQDRIEAAGGIYILARTAEEAYDAVAAILAQYPVAA